MSCIRSITGYRMSRDYAVLWNLAQKQSVVCVCDYGSSHVCRDDAQTICRDGEVAICARGIEYVSGDSVEVFALRCDMEQVEFVVPEETPK